MRKILQQLNQEVGVKGSMVISPDGLVIMEELGEDLDHQIVAAMASNMLQAIKNGLGMLGQDKFSRLILMSAHGRIVFVDIEQACLLVVTDRNLNIDWTLMEIDGVAHRLKNSWKIE